MRHPAWLFSRYDLSYERELVRAVVGYICAQRGKSVRGRARVGWAAHSSVMRDCGKLPDEVRQALREAGLEPRARIPAWVNAGLHAEWSAGQLRWRPQKGLPLGVWSLA